MTQPCFTLDFFVTFDEADPAGISYFANAYRYAHRAYERFFFAHGLESFFGGEFLAPMVHSQAKHLAPMRAGEELMVRMWIAKLGGSSFVTRYEIADHQEQKRAEVEFVAVFVDPQTFQKMKIPTLIRSVLEPFVS